MPIAAKAAPIHSGIGTNAGAEFFAGAAYYKTDTNKRLFRAGKDTNMNKGAAEKALVQARHRLEEAQARDRKKERNARTRRLIQKGAIIESVMPETNEMGLDELQNYLYRLSKRHG